MCHQMWCGHFCKPFKANCMAKSSSSVLYPQDWSVDSIVSSRLGRWTPLFSQDCTEDSSVYQGYGGKALLHLAMARYQFYRGTGSKFQMVRPWLGMRLSRVWTRSETRLMRKLFSRFVRCTVQLRGKLTLASESLASATAYTRECERGHSRTSVECSRVLHPSLACYSRVLDPSLACYSRVLDRSLACITREYSTARSRAC